MHDGVLVLAVTVSLLVIIIGGGIGIAQVFGSWECSSKARAMGVAHTYGIVQGCIIKAPNGQWVPLPNYRVL